MKLKRLPKTKMIKTGKRLGRGIGSGKGGHTVGRGTKGQKARNTVSLGFEGGQVPLYKKLPQMGGFKNPTKKDILTISLEKLNVFKEGSEITPKSLVEKGIIRKIPGNSVKILNGGELDKKLTLKGFTASKSALEKLKKSGSKIS